MSLSALVFSGLRWTGFASLSNSALQLLQVAILARMIAPDDFGLMAIVMAILSFAQIFSDLGISNAIIHHREIASRQLSILFWLNVISSGLLAALLALASPFVAKFYGRQELIPLLSLAAMLLVVTSLGQQIRTLGQKRMLFASLAKIDLAAAVVGFSTSVFLAAIGTGVFALLSGALAAAVVSSFLLWYHLADGWRPKLSLQLGQVRHFLKFGAYMIGDNLANTLHSQFDVLLGGRLLGAELIGVYSLQKTLALRVSGVFSPILSRVGLPMLATAQDDNKLLKDVYLNMILFTASVNFPIYVMLGLFAKEFVYLFFGPGWEVAIPLLRIFAVWGLLRAMGNPVGSLLMARGRADLSFKWNAVLMVLIPPVVWLGAQFGASGLTLSLTVLQIVLFIPAWYYLVRPLCGAGLREYSAKMATPLSLSLGAGLVGYLMAGLTSGSIWRLVYGATFGFLAYMLLSYTFNRMWFRAIARLVGMRAYG